MTQHKPAPVKTGVPTTKSDAGPQIFIAGLLICLVVIFLFAASLIRTPLGREIALLFIGSMIAIGAGFAVFLFETTIAARAVRVRSELLQHTVDEDD